MAMEYDEVEIDEGYIFDNSEWSEDPLNGRVVVIQDYYEGDDFLGALYGVTAEGESVLVYPDELTPIV